MTIALFTIIIFSAYMAGFVFSFRYLCKKDLIVYHNTGKMVDGSANLNVVAFPVQSLKDWNEHDKLPSDGDKFETVVKAIIFPLYFAVYGINNAVSSIKSLFLKIAFYSSRQVKSNYGESKDYRSIPASIKEEYLDEEDGGSMLK